jgi:Ca2+-binding RTX toxin-like protein
LFGQGIGLYLDRTTSQTIGTLTLLLNTSTGIENVKGSAYNDFIFGNSRSNIFETGAGNDEVDGDWGGGGDDTFILGLGNDLAYGGVGDDLFYGGEGDDNFVDWGTDDYDIGYGGDGTDWNYNVENWTQAGPNYPS